MGIFLYRLTLVMLVCAVMPVTAAQAANPDGDLRIEIISAYNLVVDSNVTTPATYAPEAATLGAKVCNDGTEVMNEVQVYIGNYATKTPGTYPEYDSSVAGAPDHVSNGGAGTGTYSLTHESGSFANNEDASRAWVGTLQPGECRTEYWVVSYPRCVNVESPPSSGTYVPQVPPCTTAITGGSTTADDIALSYDIWATGYYDTDSSGDKSTGDDYLQADDTRDLTLRSEISASANKIWPNGDNKVPEEYKAAIAKSFGWDTWTPTGSNPFPGQVFETQGIWYDLGNVVAGFDNNGDGVPDQNAWLQPVGIPDVYDPGCFRLVGTYGLLIVKGTDGGETLIPFKDQMYFENIPDNTGVVGLVFYEYAALNGKCTGTLTPYQEVASGFLNEKFSGDYGTAFDITTQEPKASIAKGVSPETAALGSELTYTLEVTNPDDYGLDSEGDPLTVTIGDPDSGNPLVIRDTIPPDTNFLLNSAKVVEPDSDIAAADVTILYTYSDGITTWTTTEAPTVQSDADPLTFDTADDVVALEWRAEVGLGHDGGGQSMKVEFKATVPGTYTEPFVSNTGCAAIGSGPCFDEDDAVTTITGSTSITGTVFEDDGTGSNNGNGTYDTADTGEVGIAGVPVSIFYDADNSGTYSEGDFLWETVTTLADGSYTSSSTLPAGDWFAVVGDLPASHDGWASTTGTVHAVTTTTGTATAPDTGFAPALTLDKQITSSSPMKEGDAVTYTIDLNNELYGFGSTQCMQTFWGSALTTTNNNVIDMDNILGAPDGPCASTYETTSACYAQMSLKNNSYIDVTGFNLPTVWDGNIVSAEIVIWTDHDSNESYDPAKLHQFNINATNNASSVYSDSIDALNLPFPCSPASPCGEQFGYGVYSTGSISALTGAALLSSSDIVVTLGTTKNGGNPPIDVDIDAVGIRITTDQPCDTPSTIIDPLPLYDTFDANKIEFASASPAPDRLVPYDDGDPATNMYRIEWDNLGPLYPSETNQVTVNFTALEPASALETVTNTAEVENAYFTSGTPANDAVDDVTVDLNATASIGDLIWFDDGDGIFQAGEPGIPGVTMYLCSATPCDSGNADQTVVTDSSGNYQFDYLDGTYYVAVDTTTLPAGFNATPIAVPPGGSGNQSDAVVVSGDTDNMDQNWGFTSTAGTITGSVWQDFDGDTNRDDNDTPFANWTVTLYNSDGTVAATTTTNADGTYSFGGLLNGDYYTTVTPLAGYTQTYDYDSILNNNSGTLTINGNTFISDVDFAYQTGDNSIGDTLYVDLNGDGIEQIGEPGIPNITVYLYEDSGSVPGVLDPGDVLLGSQVTDSNGQYLFENLPTGDYLIVPDENDADLPSVQQTGDPDESGVCTICNGMTAVTVSNGQDVDTADFGYEPDGGKIGDSIYWDVNGDGTQGTNEPGIEGVEVYLCTEPVNSVPCDPTDPEYVGTATTDADGKYLFYGLPDDDYTVSVGSIPGSPAQTADPDNNGLVCTDPLAYTCDNSQNVAINGNSYMGADFGYKPPLFIGDQLFIDTNGNADDVGGMDANDLPLANVTVQLFDDNNNFVAETETDENGNYYFVDGLSSGNYTVIVDTNDEDWPADVGTTATYNGPADTDGISNNNSISLTLGADPVTDADFGYQYDGTNTLSGTICLDGTDGNGICGSGDSGVDSDESAYEGTTVYISKWIDADGDGNVDSGELTSLAQTVTDENGDYSFTGMPSVGDATDNVGYVVSLAAPEDFLNLTTNDSNAPSADQIVEKRSGDYTSSVLQIIKADGNLTNLDIAFEKAVVLDFGDLPLPFETTLGIDGARHIVKETPDLYLGDVVTTEADGIPSVGATSDSDDGITQIGTWAEGTNGGTISVKTYGAGWFIGWIDFNGDGSFSGAGEMIKSTALGELNPDGSPKPVTTSISFDIPTGGLSSPGYARFRFFPEKPPLPSAAFKGIADNGEVEDYWFSLSPSGSIGHRLWLDLDGDGVQDGDESGLANVTVELRNEYCNAGVDCPTAVTDVNGNYIFPGVGAGDYTVAVLSDTLPAGLEATFDKDGGQDSQTAVTLAAGEVLTDVDFGYKWSGTGGVIGDRIWNDVNGDGVQDANEAGIGGVTVALQDGDGNPILDSDNNAVTAITAPDGSYTFPDLPAGNYIVEVTPPPGSTLTGDPDEAGTCSTCDSKTTTPITITSAGEIILTADFGYKYIDGTTSDIGDRIYNSNTDAGIENVTVVLKDADGNIIAQDTTDSSGNYLFPDLPQGTYTVAVTDTNGVLGALVQTFDKDGVLDGSHTLTTVAGTDYLDADFGYDDPVPTYALVSSFNAYVNSENQVVLEWKTASEIGTIGFHLERLNEQSGKYQAITKKLLPGMLTPPHGGTYRYVDKSAKAGSSYTYRVVEVAVTDQGMISGPYTVTAEQPLLTNNRMFADGPEGYTLTHQEFSEKQIKRFVARDESSLNMVAAEKKKTGDTLKIPVSKDGLVYLTATELATTSGFSENQVVQYLKAKKCLVTLAGESIPVITANTGSGLWFYGRAPERNDIAQNIYLLELGKKGVKMKNTPGKAEERVDTAQSYSAHVEVEENQAPLYFYLLNYNVGEPVKDLWAWESLLAYGDDASVVHIVKTPDTTGTDTAVVRVNLVNITSKKTGQAAPYTISLSVNGTPVGETVETSEQGDWQVEAEFPAELLEQENEIKIVSHLNNGVAYSFIFLESIEIDYPRTFQAVNGELFFTDPGYNSITVQGFRSSRVLVFDVTEPNNPLRLKTLPGKNQDGEYTVTVLTEPGHEYFITENIISTVSEELTVDVPSQLKRTENSADYLIIAPNTLLSSAQRLLDHRESQGLSSMIVDIEDVRDEFSSASAAPEAVHTFLAYAYEHWAHPPRYVTLIGDGSFDYKDYLDYGTPLVPTELVSTPDGLFPSDNATADVVGDDGVPEFALGRIPVIDSAELDAYISKLIAYEQAMHENSNIMMLVTDKSDSRAGDFQASADQVTDLASDYFQIDRVDVDTLGYSQANDSIVSNLQQGGGILHYIGHSSATGYASGKVLLSTDDIEEMNPVGSPMLMVSMACSSGFFGYPPMNSLGETAVLKADGAAVGFFGSTGLSRNYLADILSEGFYSGLFDSEKRRLGDAILQAKQHYFNVKQGEQRYTLDIYNLLGDSALLIPGKQ
ncbi:MAG: SdrD B-like domain-containing protein [Candidatus Electrothrix scaldis]|nr:MAG: SdrD B-like domain-containing protein [Candidatus Electrothrix sp. GW3-3]